MLTQNILNYILGLAALGGIVFGIYKSFHKPQEDLETKQALTDKDVSNKATILAQKELETKALILAEQVKMKNEDTERRFSEMGTRLDASMTIAQNHIHTIDTKIDSLFSTISMMSGEVIKLRTIIEERLPKK